MNLWHEIGVGKEAPNIINVIIEIPKSILGIVFLRKNSMNDFLSGGFPITSC